MLAQILTGLALLGLWAICHALVAWLRRNSTEDDA